MGEAVGRVAEALDAGHARDALRAPVAPRARARDGRRRPRRARRSRAAPKPTMAGTSSMPARRARSCAPPTTNGGNRSPRRTSSAAAPFGPPNLWPVTEQRSAPSAREVDGDVAGRRAGVDVDDDVAAPGPSSTTAAAGCSVPTSWLASCTDTSTVSGRMAAATSAGSKRPSRSTPTVVTSVAPRATASRTDECSTAVVTTCAGAAAAPARPSTAVFTASVPLAVNTTSRGRAPKRAATCSRAVFDRDPGDVSLGVQPAGIGVVLAEVREHRLERDRSQRRRRRVVEVGARHGGAGVRRGRRSDRRRRGGWSRTAATSRRRGRRASRGSSRGRARTPRAGTAARSRRTGSTPTRS